MKRQKLKNYFVDHVNRSVAVKEGKTTAKERKEIKGYQKKGYTVQNTTFKD